MSLQGVQLKTDRKRDVYVIAVDASKTVSSVVESDDGSAVQVRYTDGTKETALVAIGGCPIYLTDSFKNSLIARRV
jgi:hypothetical protein